MVLAVFLVVALATLIVRALAGAPGTKTRQAFNSRHDPR